MSKRKSTDPLPMRGYLAMIGVFGLLLGLGYAVALLVAAKSKYFVTGLLPVVLCVFLCFCAACAFDALFDRLSSRTKDREGRKG